MQMREFEAGKIIYESGQELDELHLIVKGEVKAVYRGGEMLLRAGDIVGLCEACSDTVYMTYTAVSKTSVISYDEEVKQLPKLFDMKADAVKYFMSSLFRQLNGIMGRCKVLKVQCDNLYRYLENCDKEYRSICEKHHISSSELPDYEELRLFEPEEDIAEWMSGYYASLEQMLTVWDYNKTDNDFVCGFIMKTGEDILKIIALCNEMQDYREEVCGYLMNENELDLFDMYSRLFEKLAGKLGIEETDVVQVRVKLNDILLHLQNQKLPEQSFYEKRIKSFESLVERLNNQSVNESMEEENSKEELAEISGSLEKILQYAECSESVEAAFRKNILAYKRLVNKNGTEDDVRALRRELTKQFYQIYIAAFQVSMSDPHVPTLLMMLFNFGYVDEELAGIKNALYLYRIADKMPTAPEKGVYSYYEWLKAVYEGKKEPCRNEFDMDYGEYLREQKKSGAITKEKEELLKNDNAAKVMYELEQVFPTVNKITYGRISTYCPVFSEHNVLKPLPDIVVTADKVLKVIGAIRQVDFSAFYRSTLYSDSDSGVPREYIDVEVLPDIILTPNAGTRGVMWQEIEGKKRTTPARMMSSVFQMEDLSLILIRLTGEFRWEMCKRIQGTRWNDVSERSLTSEYFDYIQFYRRNNDLSTDAKDKIKSEMAKAKNSFKEMFIKDYVQWLRFESNGSPRLNKVARNILFNWCPFAKEVRCKVATNPLYKDMADRYAIHMAQKVHHVDILCQKLKNMGKAIPEEIENQKRFLEL